MDTIKIQQHTSYDFVFFSPINILKRTVLNNIPLKGLMFLLPLDMYIYTNMLTIYFNHIQMNVPATFRFLIYKLILKTYK